MAPNTRVYPFRTSGCGGWEHPGVAEFMSLSLEEKTMGL